jgi:hypothetical protein
VADPVEVIDVGPDMDLADDLLTTLIDRLTCEKGSHWYDESIGTDLRRFVGAAVNASTIENAAEQECLGDERVADARATATLQADGTFDLALSGESSDGPFEFALTVDEVTARLLGVEGVGD